MGWREGKGLSTLRYLPSESKYELLAYKTPSLPRHKSVSVKKDWSLVRKGWFSVALDILEILHVLANTSRAICKLMGWGDFGGSVEWSQVENFTPFPSSAGGFQLDKVISSNSGHNAFAYAQKIVTDLLWLQLSEYEPFKIAKNKHWDVPAYFNILSLHTSGEQNKSSILDWQYTFRELFWYSRHGLFLFLVGLYFWWGFFLCLGRL